MRNERPGLFRTWRDALRHTWPVLFLGACLWAALIWCLVGCTDADSARRKALGQDAQVSLWSGGEAVRTWRSKGHVAVNANSSLVYFMDKETGLFVRLRGTISIETLPDKSQPVSEEE